MFTVSLALIEAKTKKEFEALYIGTVCVDILLILSITDIIIALIKK